MRMHSIDRKWELLHAAEAEFAVDADGTLWKGPTSIEDSIHYGRMQGFNDDGSVMWYGCRSDPPEVARMLGEDALAEYLFNELRKRQQ